MIVHRFSCKVLVILVRFEYDLNFLDIFEKSSNTKYELHCSTWRDGHDKTSGCFSHFYEHAE